MHGRRFAKKTALVDEEEEVTFGEVNRRVNQLTSLFHSKGLRKGDRIALLSYNSNTYAEILLAILKAGFVLVPINYRLLAKEFVYI
ncbi:AMP-binding protein, partial [Thermodesulfobacteriota bacterium]